MEFSLQQNRGEFLKLWYLNFSSHNFLQVYLCLASSVLKCHTCTPLLFQMVQESLRNWLSPPSFLPKPTGFTHSPSVKGRRFFVSSRPSWQKYFHLNPLILPAFWSWLFLTSFHSLPLSCPPSLTVLSLVGIIPYLFMLSSTSMSKEPCPLLSWLRPPRHVWILMHAAVPSPTSLLYLPTLMCQSSKIWNQNHLTSSSKTQVWTP